MKTLNKRYGAQLAGALLLMLLAAYLSLSLGSVRFSPGELWQFLTKQENGVKASIFWYARLPRTLGCLFAGAALSVAGAVIQNVLSNKLASPGIIGVNAGAGLGVTICCAMGVLSGWGISAGAFLGALCAVGVITLFSSRVSASKTMVILSGVALNSLLNAAAEAITVLVPDVAGLQAEFRVGGFSAVTYPRLMPAMCLIAVAFAVLMTLCSQLDTVTLGDELARGVGLSVNVYRTIFLVLSALLAGAAVSYGGLLGFVGLMVPHFVRRLAGNAAARLLPLCAVGGAAFVTFCDLAARRMFMPYELPVGIFLSILGGPVFVLLLVRYKGGHRHD